MDKKVLRYNFWAKKREEKGQFLWLPLMQHLEDTKNVADFTRTSGGDPYFQPHPHRSHLDFTRTSGGDPKLLRCLNKRKKFYPHERG